MSDMFVCTSQYEIKNVNFVPVNVYGYRNHLHLIDETKDHESILIAIEELPGLIDYLRRVYDNYNHTTIRQQHTTSTTETRKGKVGYE